MKIYILLLLLCTMLILQGCVSAVIVSTAVVATKTATDPRTIGTQVDDRILEVRIANYLNNDPQLKKKAHIINAVYEGKVLLMGQAPSYKLAKHAEQIATDINGTAEVYNEIRQGQPISLKQVSIDAWITTKLYSQLLIRHIVKLSNIKVNTENGEVFLLGRMTSTESRVIVEVISKIGGVKHVTTIFTYI